MGQWAEIGEGILDVEQLACRNGRRVELRVPQPDKPEPNNAAALDTRGFGCYTCGGRFGT